MHRPSLKIILLGGIFIFTVQASFARQASPPAAPVEAQQLEQRLPVERELKAKEIHAYKITLQAGQFLSAAVNQRGVDVLVRVFAPDGSKVAEVDSPNGVQGDEPIALEAKAAGTYRIEVSALDDNAQPGRYEIRVNQLLSAGAYAQLLAEKKRKQQAVVAWLGNNAIPIRTVEAGNGFADLQPLKKVFKGVRFVGLGEETHGTREFFQFKHRMLEFLVREMGFRVFAFEASYSACENINDYVMGRTDDGAKALDSQGFLVWNTEEVRALMDWMRSYNASVPPAERVKFVGFDIQVNDPGKAKLLGYLKRVAPERAADAEVFFNTNDRLLSNVAALGEGDKAREALAKLTELKNRYNDLFVFLEISGAALSAKSSPAEYEQMREYARVLTQYFDAFATADFSGAGVRRDLYMADVFRRIVGREPAGTRFVIWAHNGHISAGDAGGVYPTFGHHLRRLYGTDYYALGFSFNGGSFQASDPSETDATKRRATSFTVAAAPAGTVDWYLAQPGIKSFVVDFRAPHKQAELGEWLSTPLMMRGIGWAYNPKAETLFFHPAVIGKEYDGLFFIDTTTRARPNPSVANASPAQ